MSSSRTTLQSRRALYVGGLDPDVKQSIQSVETTIRAAFIPFGPIKTIDIPMDFSSGRAKGFAFIEYDDGDDAAEAIYNMDGAELFGKILTVNIAQAERMSLGSNKAVWSTDEWFREQSGNEQENGKQIDANKLAEKP